MATDPMDRKLLSLLGEGAQSSSHGPNVAVASGHSRQFVGTAENVHFHDALRLLDDSHLPYVRNARFDLFADGEQPSYCLENTRVQILQDIDNWAEDRKGPCIFWMSGLAGTGKSTIARTIARRYDDKNRLGASFFFSSSYDDTKRSKDFVTTIARQLAGAHPSLQDEIYQVVARRRDISRHSLEDQWHRLILDTLSQVKLEPGQLPYMLVIDALDECETTSGIKLVLNLLAQTRLLESGILRIFLTSRPDTRIECGFDNIPEDKRRCFQLHNMDDEIANHDIRIFLNYRLSRIAKYHRHGKQWPGKDKIEQLMEKAGGLFVWASTACKFVGLDTRLSSERLQQVLNDTTSIDDPKSELDRIYLTVLRSTVSEKQTASEKALIYNVIRLILGTMALLATPLSVTGLGALFQSTRHSEFSTITTHEIKSYLRELGAIVDVPEDDHRPPRLHHPTLREFLLDEGRCTELYFHVNRRQTHVILSGCCVNIMSKSWECCSRGRGIFNLDNPGIALTDVTSDQLDKWLPDSMQYACLYWAHHLKESGANVHRDDVFDHFLRTHLLHWLEALTWMQRLSDGITAIAYIESMTLGTRVHAYIYDAKRFIMSARSTIEPYPLQIYMSGLVFAPAKSVVRCAFEDEALRWMSKMPSLSSRWSSLTQQLEGGEDSAATVVFSKVGTTLASATSDGPVKIWEVATGQLLQVLEQAKPIIHICLSEDGKILLTMCREGFDAYIVRLWDAGTGHCLREFHRNSLSAVHFQSIDKLLYSVKDSGGTIRIWSPFNDEYGQNLIGHTDQVLDTIFSDDGTLLASSSDDRKILVWEVTTGNPLRELGSKYRSRVSRLTFSKDKQHLACVSLDGLIQVWNLETDASLPAISEPPSDYGPYRGIQFSEDGQMFATISYQEIQLWDVMAGHCFKRLNNYSTSSQVSFSPDGKLLAAPSYGLVRIWDLTIDDTAEESTFIEPSLCDIQFSGSGKYLAALDFVHEVWLWDAISPRLIKKLEASRSGMNAIKTHDILESRQTGLDRIWNRPNFDFSYGTIFIGDEKMLSWTGSEKRLWDLPTGQCMLVVDMGQKHGVPTSERLLFVHPSTETDFQSLLITVYDAYFRHHPVSSVSNSQLRFEDGWILSGTQKLLRFPADQRHDMGYAVHGNTFAKPNSVKDVRFFQFAL